MDSTDPDSTCFAVGHLKQGLKGSKRTGIKAGTVKDFVVEKHLTVFRQGTQHHTRNFTFLVALDPSERAQNLETSEHEGGQEQRKRREQVGREAVVATREAICFNCASRLYVEE